MPSVSETSIEDGGRTQDSSRSKQYRPKPGSAGYALLIALYKEELSPEYQVYHLNAFLYN
jgi:hypothetical protein